MLSKILSGRDAGKAQPIVFARAADRRVEPVNEAKAAAGCEALEAEKMALQEALRKLEAEVAATRTESFEAGRKQGEASARRELTPVLEKMTASIAEIVSLRNDYRRRAEKDVIELSLLIAKRVLHREVSVDPNALTALARVVFERLVRTETYRVTLHPQFASAIGAALPGTRSGTVQIDPDPACALGAFVIRSNEGVIDASVDAQLEEISRGLIDRLANS